MSGVKYVADFAAPAAQAATSWFGPAAAAAAAAAAGYFYKKKPNPYQKYYKESPYKYKKKPPGGPGGGGGGGWGKGRRRRWPTNPGKPYTLAKRVRKLETTCIGTKAVLRYRKRFVAIGATNQNSINRTVPNTISCTNIEEPLAVLRMFNPADPGNYTTVNFTTGTQIKAVEIAAIEMSVLGRNNYNVPIKVSLHLCIPKVDTSETPLSAFTAGMADVSTNTLDASAVQVKLWFSPQFRDLWSVKRTITRVVKPGEEIYMKHISPGFKYDPAFFDTHNLEYQKLLGGSAILMELEGRLAHDSTSGGVSTCPAKIDVISERNLTVKYEGGADIEYVIVSDAIQVPTISRLVNREEPVFKTLAIT